VIRQAAAVLDALDHEMTVEQIETYLCGLTPYRLPITLPALLRARSDLVSTDPQGCLSLRKEHPDLGKVRAEIRRMARPVLLQREMEKRMAPLRAEDSIRLLTLPAGDTMDGERLHEQLAVGWAPSISLSG
jgi:hypothetical protein